MDKGTIVELIEKATAEAEENVGDADKFKAAMDKVAELEAQLAEVKAADARAAELAEKKAVIATEKSGLNDVGNTPHPAVETGPGVEASESKSANDLVTPSHETQDVFAVQFTEAVAQALGKQEKVALAAPSVLPMGYGVELAAVTSGVAGGRAAPTTPSGQSVHYYPGNPYMGYDIDFAREEVSKATDIELFNDYGLKFTKRASETEDATEQLSALSYIYAPWETLSGYYTMTRHAMQVLNPTTSAGFLAGLYNQRDAGVADRILNGNDTNGTKGLKAVAQNTTVANPAALTQAVLDTLFSSVTAKYSNGKVWGMGQVSEGKVRGKFTQYQQAGMNWGEIYGRPIIYDDNIHSVGAANAEIYCFNPRALVVREGTSGAQIIVDPYTGSKSGQVTTTLFGDYRVAVLQPSGTSPTLVSKVTITAAS